MIANNMILSSKFSVIADELLTTHQMYAADAATIEQGLPGCELMENAGRGVVVEITKRFQCQPVLVICGPGNNGGDGFVIARLLKERGWPTRLVFLGTLNSLSPDAADKAKRWSGETEKFTTDCLNNTGLVVDAIFGAGLTRNIEGDAARVIEEINCRGLTCIAVDIPSGIDGNTGEILGVAPHCELTVTFFRKKPGHFLYPGRRLSGEISLVDICINTEVLRDIKATIFQNNPKQWVNELPSSNFSDHKFKRGCALIVGGLKMTGAARLAARSAARAGAGLVTIACPPEAKSIYSNDDPSFLIKSFSDADDFVHLLSDERITSVLIGPGCGVNQTTIDITLATLKTDKFVVLDADALTVFGDCRNDLIEAIQTGNVVLTPHEGEFSRLFNYTGDKLARCRAAATETGAAVILKGADTVIAAPDGKAIINSNAPSTLATAGSGDVLSGVITGLLAQGMGSFLGAAASVWIHGQAAANFGVGLIASDIPQLLPNILKQLNQENVE